jgi:hypothetical protein
MPVPPTPLQGNTRMLSTEEFYRRAQFIYLLLFRPLPLPHRPMG